MEVKHNLHRRYTTDHLFYFILYIIGVQLSDIAHTLTTDDILQYLETLKLREKYEESFKYNDIDGDAMIMLTKNDDALKELGMELCLHRVKIQSKFISYLESILVGKKLMLTN